ncbi:MAG: hypothetical protein PHH98_00660 [Candidatus Gracilibacteria bacterium]|nr:hypothetical protein [Candidatus Gracilibacteria bacterium]
MVLKPSEIEFIKDEPAFLLNNGSTVMPTTRVVIEDSKEQINNVCSK